LRAIQQNLRSVFAGAKQERVQRRVGEFRKGSNQGYQGEKKHSSPIHLLLWGNLVPILSQVWGREAGPKKNPTTEPIFFLGRGTKRKPERGIKERCKGTELRKSPGRATGKGKPKTSTFGRKSLAKSFCIASRGSRPRIFGELLLKSGHRQASKRKGRGVFGWAIEGL